MRCSEPLQRVTPAAPTTFAPSHLRPQPPSPPATFPQPVRRASAVAELGVVRPLRPSSTHIDQRYHTGEEIHIGDRVSYHGCPGSVVFVIDRREFSAKFPENWSYLGSGFMVQNSEFGLVHLSEADEDLKLLSRATAVA